MGNTRYKADYVYVYAGLNREFICGKKLNYRFAQQINVSIKHVVIDSTVK